MDIKNITTDELAEILSKRSLSLKGVYFGHPIDVQSKINYVQIVFDEIKSRVENYKENNTSV